ncbi:hypothetical protein EVAR_100143_1 [Eumeta japonica]|uniref:Uncharacterized protein n=1 Tax=Eumeta variegata TaxID=151549 RepID=A0A4C1ZU19_EUMVA|nr:hypothetical protein EVAR_100143_1 [Eumeta japonica]
MAAMGHEPLCTTSLLRMAVTGHYILCSGSLENRSDRLHNIGYRLLIWSDRRRSGDTSIIKTIGLPDPLHIFKGPITPLPTHARPQSFHFTSRRLDLKFSALAQRGL